MTCQLIFLFKNKNKMTYQLRSEPFFTWIFAQNPCYLTWAGLIRALKSYSKAQWAIVDWTSALINGSHAVAPKSEQSLTVGSRSSEELPLRCGVGSHSKSFGTKSPKRNSLQLPILLWSFLRSLRSPLPLYPQSPVSHSPFLFNSPSQTRRLWHPWRFEMLSAWPNWT